MRKNSETEIVSVVILTFNRRKELAETLNEMKKQTYPNFETIVVDNNSSDGTYEMVKKEYPEIRLIGLSENIGIKGYNAGFQTAKGKIIVVMDDDSHIEPQGLEKMAGKFRKDPKLGALGIKIFNYYTNKIHHWHPGERREVLSEDGVDAPLFNGCAAAVLKSVLDKVGYYPEEFFLYENERDLCTRIISNGYSVKYFTDIVGYHKGAVSFNYKDSRLVFYSSRNRLWYYWKYIPAPLVFYATIKASMTFLCKAVLNLVYLKALLAAYWGMPMILKNRKPIGKEFLKKAFY